MNKSVSISLGGLSFFIEEDAFHKLQRYLEDVKSSLETEEEDTEEILKDVEARIAELFKEWLGNYRQVIDKKDVDKVISIMGTPEQYNSESEAGEDEFELKKESKEKDKFYQRQLYRDTDDKIIAGVCSGLAHFFGIEPIWFRLGLVLLILIASWYFNRVANTLVLIYIILWIIIPKATTTLEKLKMKGKPVNFDSIKKYIDKDEISEQTGKIKNNFSKASNEIGGFLESIFKILIKIIAIFTGIIFEIISISFIISYFICAFSLSLPGINSSEYINLIFDSSWQLYIMVFLIGIILLIPSFILLFIGLNMITGKNIIKFSKTAKITLFIIWIISSIIIILMSASLFLFQFRETVEKTQKNVLNNVASDTLSIDMKDYQGKTNNTYITVGEGIYGINTDQVKFINDSVIKKINKTLKIKKSSDSNFYLEVKSIATGNNELNAIKNIDAIHYKYHLKNNKELMLDPYLSFPKNIKFRNQDIKLVLYVPENKYIKITYNVQKVIYLNPINKINIYHNRGKYSNKIFKFTNDSLKCVNCNEIVNSD
ncbi:PspC domain-containing protein [Apibacter adventoris]|uniref:PspC domain-containing protein n=1 Tax=Apibacter adventoris TaxID=1679466 RepID=UPI000CF666EB|nr:PspC domain-containing protein [Apibacter adventoris]PQL95148.1 hypothetical protein C4S76_02870 [Apibacter adventoris]